MGTVDAAFVGSTVMIFDTYNGVTTVLGTTTVGPGGVWSKTVSLAGNGLHSIVALDSAAASSSAPVVFTLDIPAPTVTIGAAGGLTNQATQTISGTVTSTEAAPGATVTLYDNGVEDPDLQRLAATGLGAQPLRYPATASTASLLWTPTRSAIPGRAYQCCSRSRLWHQRLQSARPAASPTRRHRRFPVR